MLNRVLFFDKGLLEKIQNLGKITLCFEIKEIPNKIYLTIDNNQISFLEKKFDIFLSGNLIDFLKFKKNIQITGNLELSEKLYEIYKDFHFDFDLFLSKLIGEMPSTISLKFFKFFFNRFRKKISNLHFMAKDYLTYELKALPHDKLS